MSKPTFPSLLAEETRAAAIEYLSTTFALADGASRTALEEFLRDPESGVFRGPFLKVRTPYKPVADSWESPLEWMPQGFRPFQHQAEAFGRLTTLRRAARPTIVTTGTGSGKTESFLVPLLDHALRASARGERGIKAIVLYPMNALVTDQARRLAGYLHADPALSEVTAGVYIGGEGKRKVANKYQLVDHRETLRQNPPDILLTNYKMLDLLLLRQGDNPLWENATATMQYLVLDEFHTYDGAQGTDVAMLIRRLGARLQVAEAGRPLGRITPVATSATLGGGSRSEELRQFAETIFGCAFEPDSLIVETALAAGEVVPKVNYELEIPSVDRILDSAIPDASISGSWEALARAVLEPHADSDTNVVIDYRDPVAIGDVLRTHFLTRVVIDALKDRPLTPAEAVVQIAQDGVLPWGMHNSSRPAEVQLALLKFLALLSVAKVDDGHGNLRSMISVQVQLWVRELTRMIRRVSSAPEFAWWHDAPADLSSYLPAAHCRVCGRSGWVASTTELGESLAGEAVAVWRNSARPSARSKTKVLLLASAGEANVKYLNTETLEFIPTPEESAVPVHVTPDEDQAADQVCPSCGARNAIRFMGSSLATLVSVGLTSEFGSTLLADSEKKTLVFTDSVQDAAHRASFIEGRAFQFNFRSKMLGATSGERTTLSETARRLLANTPVNDIYPITPPDFTRRMGLDGEWLADDANGHLRSILSSRIAFQAQLEVGLNSRIGRTLELTGAVVVDIDVDLDAVAQSAQEAHQIMPQLSLESALDVIDYPTWIFGVLEHLRINGGIHHNWLRTYVREEGNRWSIWGRAAEGMPQFPFGRPAPSFYTTGAVGKSDFQSLNPRGESWLTDWTKRCLQVTNAEARALLVDVVGLLAGTGMPLEQRTGEKGSKVYGLAADKVIIDPNDIVRLQCPVCHHLQPAAASRAYLWDGAVCPRMRCPGHLERVELDATNFYRTMYQSHRIRRIVSQEHTGLLDREEREEIEARFKSSRSPVDPNILACTPTLELGIDIGDLSTVALASLPRSTANYLQRVGRAGRSTGNAFIFAAVSSSPRDLYYFAQPTHLIAGEVIPPGAYLNATELLHRQYFAFCLDRLAAGTISTAQPMPSKLDAALDHGMDDGKWLRAIVDAATADAENLASRFLDLFGSQLGADAQQNIHTYAAEGLRDDAARAALKWQTEGDEIRSRLGELAKVIADLDRHGHLDDKQVEDRKRCSGESRALADQLYERGKQETLTGLGGVGLLPNYNLLDDSTTLDVHLWWIANEGKSPEPQALDLTYQRSSSVALTELAPGAFFYAGGKRVEIDAVDVGPASQPTWRLTRLCPSCGWGSTDVVAALSSCPRCHNPAVTDSGAIHKVLILQKVSAVHRLDDVLIDDESDDRTRTFFSTVSGVDVAPIDITKAWRLKDRVFGAEYARSANIRTLNLGLGDTLGNQVEIAGETVAAGGFTTCALCGVVARRANDTAEVRHRGFCATRRGAPEQWENLLLSHELRTQAVRLLLPVSMLHYETTQTSFKGALLLGLRRDFGGDPQHLNVLASSMSDGSATRRFLVLHDTVPGGTGYLDRFGEPDRMKAILELARTALRECPCRTESTAACHRCLYGVLSAREMSFASRESALKLLDMFLDDWDVEEVPTVTGIDIAPVQLSELELQFREALKQHVSNRPGCSFETANGSTGEELDLRLVGPDGDVRRWRMRPLVQVKASVWTEPDFLLTRSDAQDLDVAVYLDGQKFHASSENNITHDDAIKRDALRRDGKRVWSITWQDVQAFASDKVKDAIPDLVHQQVQNSATESVQDKRLKTLWQNPIDMLIEYLADPDSELWARGSFATVIGMVNPPGKHGTQPPILTNASALPKVLQGALAGALPESEPNGPLVVVPRVGRSGLPLFICADPADFEPTTGVLVALDDRDSEIGGPKHSEQWRDWLRWSNILQFLTVPRHGESMPLRMAEIWTRKSADAFAGVHVPLSVAGSGKIDVAFAIPNEWGEVLQYSDTSLAPLVAALAERGSALPEPGIEVGPDNAVWQLELAWPAAKVAVVVDEEPDREAWLAGEHWKVIHASNALDVEALVATLTELVGGSR
ncbi:DEAD/DEAH box helicase [Candidatus Mycobacterium wuenschmannii]|uniref:DEAD/DEAH box helicase n=1 Tax=Candidatus Mycobacterium wuenschmannii TaxID=3027808 RepID=A0ABY8VUW1_9MYCO|nr:DEAD/DEAH box helicase [Candidatus Mycobacterium wuenschmannii]WIM87435.1 DEAD/DEAH box helicase [Candidatus Mycobacterium wuenschmannii]